MLALNAPNLGCQVLYQNDEVFRAGPISADRVKPMPQKVIEVFHLKAALLDRIEDLDETEGLAEGIIYFDRLDRISSQRFYRIETAQRLEANDLRHGEFQSFGQQTMA